jgi:GNAT superfamily N-acetyltransferase
MRAADFLIENIELRHEPTSTGGVEIHAYRDGQAVGWVRFQKLRTGQYKAAMVHVPERYRRQGVGTAMYQYARNELGLDVVPSDSQTELGQAFWNKQQAQDQQLAERKKRRSDLAALIRALAVGMVIIMDTVAKVKQAEMEVVAKVSGRAWRKT